jgi:outer membrane immunogenic protein
VATGGITMRRQIFVAGIVAAALSAPAFGADLPPAPVYKAPVAAPAPFSWTGFYVGGEVGAKFSDTTWTATSLEDINAGKPAVDASSPRNFTGGGVRAGGYVGYNWQFAPQWVGGIEGDIAWADKTITSAGLPGCTIVCFPGFPGPQNDVTSVKTGWDASARVRLGFLVTPQTLLYGTGGVAWQFVQASGTCQHSTPDPFCLVLPGNPFVTVTNSTVRTGWTVGAGVETSIYGHWLLRAEYRFADFGTWNNTFDFNLPGEAAGTDTYRFRLRDIEHIATVGLSYKF